MTNCIKSIKAPVILNVVAGRMMGAATVAKLHANKQFMIDLDDAKKN